jgi:stress response protein YsnF
MSQTVTAMYDMREEAGRALNALRAEVPLSHADIYDRTDASLQALRRLDLTPDERSACESKLENGGYLLLARPQDGESPESIIAVLERLASEPAPETGSGPTSEADGPIAGSRRVVAEERIPLVEEELQVGTREVLRGGVRVRTRVEEVPVAQEVELLREFVRVGSRPASRPVSEQELERGGLLRDRVIEIAEVREEAVVSKEVFVREEVVVSKTTERRVEQIHETVRRTVVETEDLGDEVTGGRGQP